MSAYDAGLSIGNMVSLALIFLTLVVLLVTASRTRTLKSFQTEILLFAVVLFAAEVPEILSSLGIVNLTSIALLGGELHAASMTIIVVFVAHRFYDFLKAK